MPWAPVPGAGGPGLPAIAPPRPTPKTITGALAGVLTRLDRTAAPAAAPASPRGHCFSASRRSLGANLLPVRIRACGNVRRASIDDSCTRRKVLLHRLAGLRIGADDLAAVGRSDPDALAVVTQAAGPGAFGCELADQLAVEARQVHLAAAGRLSAAAGDVNRPDAFIGDLHAVARESRRLEENLHLGGPCLERQLRRRRCWPLRASNARVSSRLCERELLARLRSNAPLAAAAVFEKLSALHVSSFLNDLGSLPLDNGCRNDSV